MKKMGTLLGGRYEMVQPLGAGGMGSVFLVRDLKVHGKLRAAKLVQGGSLTQRIWEREAKVLVTLDHPYLPEVIDVWKEDEEGWIIMEYVEGETVEQRFQRHGRRLPLHEVVRIGKQLSELLAYLHDTGPTAIMHRDLKPSNVMLDKQGHVRLIDFGIASLQERSLSVGLTEQSQSTRTLGRYGTPQFASPEQLAGRAVDTRSDLYQLGGLLYYLVNRGVSPAGRSALSLPTDELPQLMDILLRLLQGDPALRFQSASEARRAFEQLDSHLAAVSLATLHEDRLPSLILVGGLYSGAGSTFLTMALAAAWMRAGMPCGVLELPGGRAEHYHLLNGEEHRPRSYRFLCNRALEQDGLRAAARWQQYGTLWYPLPPDRPAGMKTDAVQLRRMIDLCESGLVFADIGTCWDQDTIRALLPRAAAIVCAVDPFPAKAGSREANWAAAMLESYTESNIPIHWVANKASADIVKPWLRTMPVRPSCVVPNIPHAAVTKAIWNGGLVQFEKAAGQRIDAALAPLLQQLMSLRTHAVDNCAKS